MPKKAYLTTKDILLFNYLFIFRILAGFLPLRLVRLCCIPVANIYSALYIRKQKSLQDRLNLAFKERKTDLEIQNIAVNIIRNALFRMVDDIILNRLSAEDLLQCSVINGLENVESALSAKNGVILVSGHFFCNRVGKRLLHHMGFPILNIRNEFASGPGTGSLSEKYLKRYAKKMLDKVISDFVYIHQKGAGLQILKRLRGNGLVNIHLDAIQSFHAILLPFLGLSRPFPTGFLRLAQATGTALVPMLCLGNSKSFTVDLGTSVALHKNAATTSGMRTTLEQLVRILESQIEQYPDQWGGWLWDQSSKTTRSQSQNDHKF
ncbi:lysophospholipid acyltransferase family protein [candidate division CSSED10-310 bacterium]|uniref:Lysophospholipid acyltransferase family protein n=1 Tax=candidate division CSSED10-310 bacterium TaxID=2855610 RepID=A0ABV6YVJ5_UNCC1